jgi:hypothetical protein
MTTILSKIHKAFSTFRLTAPPEDHTSQKAHQLTLKNFVLLFGNTDVTECLTATNIPLGRQIRPSPSIILKQQQLLG